MTKVTNILLGLAWASFLVMGLMSAATALPASAQTTFAPGSPSGALNQAAGETTLAGGEDQVFVTIGNVVNIILGLLGIVFFILLLWAGFIWMTARGDTDKVAEATRMITQAVVGIIIILSAFAISNFAISQLLDATTSS